MSAMLYANDPRVASSAVGSVVTLDDVEYYILWSSAIGWHICTGPRLTPGSPEPITDPETGVPMFGFPDEDAAIAALIGEP